MGVLTRPHHEVDQRDQAVLGRGRAAGRRLVRDQVALAEHHRLSVHAADRLHDVHVLAHDRVDRGRTGEPVCERALLRAHRRHELGAPVEVHDHNARAVAPGPARVAQDRPRRREVHAPRVRHGLAVRDGRVRQERDPHALSAEQRDPPSRPGRARGSGCLHARPAQRVEGGVDSVLTRVEGVVRGRAARVPAHPPHGAGEVRRGVEHRVALHRPGHERRLHVAQGEVRARDHGPHRREQRREVVATPTAEASARAVPPACGSGGRRMQRPSAGPAAHASSPARRPGRAP